MKRLFYILCLFCATDLSAQTFEFGAGMSFTKFDGQVFNEDQNQFLEIDPPVQLTYNAIFSVNIPLKYLKDEIVVGVNPTAGLSLYATSVSIDIPLLATIKLGAGSSDQTDAVLGAGFGVGGQFSVFSTYLNPGTVPVQYSGVMLLPTVMGEASVIFKGYNMYQLRLEITPVPVRRISDKFNGEFSQINIRLLRSFL